MKNSGEGERKRESLDSNVGWRVKGR